MTSNYLSRKNPTLSVTLFCFNIDLSFSLAGVLFNWIVLGVCIYIVAMVLDPVDSLKHQDGTNTDTLSNCEDTRCWTRRFRWIFCCLISDKNSQEAFSKVAS